MYTYTTRRSALKAFGIGATKIAVVLHDYDEAAIPKGYVSDFLADARRLATMGA